MAKKRSNGEGSIYKRKDGKWCATITLCNDLLTGKPKRQSFYGSTRQEVSNKLIESQSRIQNGSYIEPSNLTLGQWLDYFLYEYKKASIRPKTFENYEYLIRVHLKPRIGKEPIIKLTPEIIQNFYNFLSSKGRSDGKGGLSPKTVRSIHNLLHDSLTQAVKSGKLLRNVSEATTLPRKQPKQIQPLSMDDELKFLETAATDRLGIAFIVSLSTGMRLGELLGLSWSCVDLSNGIINVKQALVRVKIFDENHNYESKLIFQEPKTNAGKRNIPIPPTVLALVNTHRLNQLKEKLLVGDKYKDGDLVFCTELGSPIEPRNFIRKFQQLLRLSGLEKTNIHSLRHTYATRLLELNEHPKVVQELLGHATIAVTLDIYSHVFPEIKKAAADKINDLFNIKNIYVKEQPSSYAV